jgi:hypothetical protein
MAKKKPNPPPAPKPGDLLKNFTKFLQEVAQHGHTKADVEAAFPQALAAAFPGK